jgi:hypothetical protein
MPFTRSAGSANSTPTAALSRPAAGMLRKKGQPLAFISACA